jgi:hypothetical protein
MPNAGYFTATWPVELFHYIEVSVPCTAVAVDFVCKDEVSHWGFEIVTPAWRQVDPRKARNMVLGGDEEPVVLDSFNPGVRDPSSHVRIGNRLMRHWMPSRIRLIRANSSPRSAFSR